MDRKDYGASLPGVLRTDTFLNTLSRGEPDLLSHAHVGTIGNASTNSGLSGCFWGMELSVLFGIMGLGSVPPALFCSGVRDVDLREALRAPKNLGIPV